MFQEVSGLLFKTSRAYDRVCLDVCPHQRLTRPLPISPSIFPPSPWNGYLHTTQAVLHSERVQRSFRGLKNLKSARPDASYTSYHIICGIGVIGHTKRNIGLFF